MYLILKSDIKILCFSTMLIRTTTKLLLFGTIMLCIIQISVTSWKTDRSRYRYLKVWTVFLKIFTLGPKVMGDKIPLHTLIPNTKELQKRIVTYHNYLRSRVIPKAANMLRLVRQNFTLGCFLLLSMFACLSYV